MATRQKRLEKALKFLGVDKEKWEDVLEFISDDEEEVEKEVEEKVKEQPEKKEELKEAEEPKEEEQVEKKKPVDELDIQSMLEKLGIEQIKTVVSNQAKEIDALKEQVKKTSVAGAQVKKTPDDDEDEYNFDNLFGKISTSKVTYTKK